MSWFKRKSRRKNESEGELRAENALLKGQVKQLIDAIDILKRDLEDHQHHEDDRARLFLDIKKSTEDNTQNKQKTLQLEEELELKKNELAEFEQVSKLQRQALEEEFRKEKAEWAQKEQQAICREIKKQKEELLQQLSHVLLRTKDNKKVLQTLHDIITGVEQNQKLLTNLDSTINNIFLPLLQTTRTATDDFKVLSPDERQACKKLSHLVGANWRLFAFAMGLDPIDIKAIWEGSNNGLQDLYWKIVSLCQERGYFTMENLKEACRLTQIDLNHGTPMPQAHVNIMEKMHKQLVEHIVEAHCVLLSLRERVVLPSATIEYILEPTVATKRKEKLLEIVKDTLGYGDECLPIFIESLWDSGHDFLAQELEKAMADIAMDADTDDNTVLKTVVSDSATVTRRRRPVTFSSMRDYLQEKRRSKRKSVDEPESDDKDNKTTGGSPIVFKWNQYSSPKNKKRKLPFGERTCVTSIKNIGIETNV